MAKYIVKRVAMGIFSVFIVATLTFFIMNLVPGGPFVAEKSISKAAQQALAEKYGLDKPLGAQYLNYMNSLIHGDMGLSLKQRGRTVNQIIFSKLPVSARTAGLAVLVALCVGIPLGCISAYNRGKWADNLIIVLATCGIAIPSFISSVVLLYTFGMNLKILPTVGLNEPAAYIMPVTALAIYPTAYITRLMRSSLLDVMGQDYMRTARAKGVSSVKILFKHALRNAILPVVTYVGPMLAGLMTGSFVVEKIFSKEEQTNGKSAVEPATQRRGLCPASNDEKKALSSCARASIKNKIAMFSLVVIILIAICLRGPYSYEQKERARFTAGPVCRRAEAIIRPTDIIGTLPPRPQIISVGLPGHPAGSSAPLVIVATTRHR